MVNPWINKHYLKMNDAGKVHNPMHRANEGQGARAVLQPARVSPCHTFLIPLGAQELLVFRTTEQEDRERN